MTNALKIRLFLATSIAFIVLMFLSSCGSSRRIVGLEQGWELIGQRKVNFLRDKDVIEVRTRTQFTEIRFKVEDRDVRINDVKIVFENGDKLEPNIDDIVPADQYSRVIELARDGRFIDRIEFRYRTTGNVLKGRANVLIVGKRFNLYGN